MPYDTPNALRQTATRLRDRPLARTLEAKPAATAPSATRPAAAVRPIEPMLLLHQEQAKTMRMIGRHLARAFRAIAH